MADVINETEVYFIIGNHDVEESHNYQNLVNSKLSDRNLHGKVLDIAGFKVAGLSGVFHKEIWHPKETNPNPLFENYDDYKNHLNLQVELNKINDANMNKKLLTHKASIFFEDWLNLQEKHADILITHDAPSCHPYGFVENR